MNSSKGTHHRNILNPNPRQAVVEEARREMDRKQLRERREGRKRFGQGSVHRVEGATLVTQTYFELLGLDLPVHLELQRFNPLRCHSLWRRSERLRASRFDKAGEKSSLGNGLSLSESSEDSLGNVFCFRSL